jgi:ElaB/YqjD/DUF883 family membrane-anchored ribosome-binding protein
VQDRTRNANEEVREEAQGIGDRANEMRERTGEVMEERRDDAANALERAADRMHDNANGMSSGMGSEIVGGAAEQTERAAGYIRTHGAGDVMSDMEGYVRDHPMQGLAAAVAAGFVVGRMLR